MENSYKHSFLKRLISYLLLLENENYIFLVLPRNTKGPNQHAGYSLFFPLIAFTLCPSLSICT